ncbi:hypothetical protein C0J09_11035 [Bordetella avium]|nr:hypothetical protein C0J09_11035 [Bordetella avium]
MDKEGKFWATIWAIAAVCLLSIVAAIYAYETQRDKRVEDMVKAGADPMYAACSLSTIRTQICAVYFAGRPAR